MKIEDYCTYCSARKGNCDFKEHEIAPHEFEPFVENELERAICVGCDRMQYASYSRFVGDWAIGCHTCHHAGNIERFEDYSAPYNTEPNREDVNSTEVEHKAVKHYDNWPSPKPPFESSLEYDTDKPEYISTGPDRFIDLVRIICANHKVEPLVDDYKVALRLCEEVE